jgi:anaerobic magnesium-protoporphyrin IX monomethyl ester cyclase
MLYPPLGAAFLAAQLRKHRIETKIFDCTFGTVKQLQRDLIAYQPEIVGIYSMVTLSRNTFRIAEMVRAHLPNCLLVAGGPLPTLYPERYSRHFDAVFQGEADLSFPRFCHDFLANKNASHSLDDLPLDSYAGLFIQNHSAEVYNPTIHYNEQEINSFPLPDRSDFDHVAYQKEWLNKTGLATTSIITTLGCPFNCDFCSRPVFGNLFRRRDLEVVFTEIDQIRRLGYKGLWIADDNFTLDYSYLTGFCQRIAGQHMSWSCLSRVTGINAEIAFEMKEAG